MWSFIFFYWVLKVLVGVYDVYDVFGYVFIIMFVIEWDLFRFIFCCLFGVDMGKIMKFFRGDYLFVCYGY